VVPQAVVTQTASVSPVTTAWTATTSEAAFESTAAVTPVTVAWQAITVTPQASVAASAVVQPATAAWEVSSAEPTFLAAQTAAASTAVAVWSANAVTATTAGETVVSASVAPVSIIWGAIGVTGTPVVGPSVTLAAPHAQWADQYDGSGVEVNIGYASDNTTNTVFAAPFGQGVEGLTWTSCASRSNNGIVSFSAPAGKYLGYVRSTRTGTSGKAVSDIYGFTISNAIGGVDDELYYRCMLWAQSEIVALGLSHLDGDNTMGARRSRLRR
jgi:hypothetical protein